MNNTTLENLAKLRDYKFYLENFCKIKTKEKGLSPFVLNNAQIDLFNTLNKDHRVIILKARQLGFCLSPETKVLTTDFKWVSLDDIKIGQEVISVDEHVLGGSGSSRKMRRAIVENKFEVFEPAFKITMSNGTIIEATAPHKFLFKERGRANWRKISDARVGDEIILLTEEKKIGEKMPWNGNSWAKIISIEPMGSKRMIDLQTSEKTYIAEGLVSHNSTGVTGFFYVDTIMNPGTTTVLVGYNTDLVAELLDKVKTFYKTTPNALRPVIHYNSKNEISFPKTDSKILILPSTKDVGRGYTIHNLLVTELSSWDDAEEKMGGLEESVPKNGRIVIESTPRGQGDLFHRMFMTDNGYTKKQYGWWWGYSQEEMDAKRKAKGEQWFSQEYGLEFLSSGRPVFEYNIIKEQRKNILNVGDKNGEDFTVYEEDGWVVFKEPEPDVVYAVGGDSSEGVEGGDNSSASIWNRRTGEQVAMYVGLIASDTFGEVLDKWGRRYNNALMVVEINNTGLNTITVLKNRLYPCLYYRQSKFETLSNTPTDRLGWRTTSVTKPLLIGEFIRATREKDLIIRSKKLIDEMSVFVYDDNGNMNPQKGFHDDTIFGAAIGYQGFKCLTSEAPTQIDLNQNYPSNFAY